MCKGTIFLAKEKTYSRTNNEHDSHRICIYGKLLLILVNLIPHTMKSSELIKRLQAEIEANGDNEIVIEANRHSYRDTKVIAKEGKTILALFDKIAD